MMTVLVPFKTLVNRFPQLLKPQGKPSDFQDDLHALIKLMLVSVRVDDTRCRRRYPDVRAAVDAGEYRSTRDYFIEHGYFEGRLSCRLTVDEAWYAESNDDVLAGLRNREITSAEDHFNEYGYGEGRLPIRL